MIMNIDVSDNVAVNLALIDDLVGVRFYLINDEHSLTLFGGEKLRLKLIEAISVLDKYYSNIGNKENTPKMNINVKNDSLTFAAFRQINLKRCNRWHPNGINSWSYSDWLTAVTGELGELASLIKMKNRERDDLVGNKFSPTDKHISNEIADILIYLDLLAASFNINLENAVKSKFNDTSSRVGFPERL